MSRAEYKPIVLIELCRIEIAEEGIGRAGTGGVLIELCRIEMVLALLAVRTVPVLIELCRIEISRSCWTR